MIVNTNEKSLGKLLIKLGVAVSFAANRMDEHPLAKIEFENFARYCDRFGRELVPVEYGKQESETDEA